MVEDLIYGLRRLARAPLFSGTVIVAILLGAGVNIGLFSVLDALLLRRLPVPRSEELVAVSVLNRAGQYDVMPLLALERLAPHRELFTSISGYTGGGAATVTVGDRHYAAALDAVTGSYFTVIGIPPAAGRLLLPEDTGSGPEVSRALVVLGYRFCTRHWRTTREAIGQTIKIEGVPFTVVGVSAEGFPGLQVGTATDLTIPLTTLPRLIGASNDPWSLWAGYAVARLRPGLSLSDAGRRIAAIWPAVIAPAAEHAPTSQHREDLLRTRPLVVSAQNGLSLARERYVRPLWILVGLTALILAMACLNVAGLAVARSAAQEQELALRLALGAPRTRLIRLVALEIGMLCVIGVSASVPLASWVARSAAGLLGGGVIPMTLDVSPHWPAFGVAAALALASAVPSSAMAAARLRARSLAAALASGSRSTRTGSRWIRVLATIQIGMSFSLLVGTILFVTTLVALRQGAPRLPGGSVLLAPLLPQPGSSGVPLPDAYLSELTRRLADLRSVGAVAFADTAPASGMEVLRLESVQGTGSKSDRTEAVVVAVSPGFFETLGVPLVQGRDLLWDDAPSRPRVAIVSSTLSRRLFGEDPGIGQLVAVGADSARGSIRVVGVVADSAVFELRERRRPIVFLPLSQEADRLRAPVAIVRIRGPLQDAPEAVPRLVASFGRHYVPQLRTLEEQLGFLLVGERLVALLSSVWGALGGLLATLSVYSVLHLQLVTRRREFAVRLALGAAASNMLWPFLRNVLALTSVGLVMGVSVTLASSRVTRTLLYGVSPTDPTVLFGVGALLLGVTVAAAWNSARRAFRVNVVDALRAD